MALKGGNMLGVEAGGEGPDFAGLVFGAGHEAGDIGRRVYAGGPVEGGGIVNRGPDIGLLLKRAEHRVEGGQGGLVG